LLAGLSEEEKQETLKDMGEKEQLICQVIDNEQMRQVKHFEKVQLETANRRMRKMKQKQVHLPSSVNFLSLTGSK
jgi:hypothetical protein